MTQRKKDRRSSTPQRSSRPERPTPPPPPPRSRRAIAIALGATLVLLALDLGSKEWAQGALSAERLGEQPPVCEPDENDRTLMQRLPTAPVVIVPDYLEMRYAENCGAAFGIMRTGSTLSRVVFVLAALLATIALSTMFVRGRGRSFFAASVPLVISGALGNLVDRIRHGYVVDFIKFDIPEVINYPTFNVADCGITVGVILLVLDGFREGRAQAAAERSASEKAAVAKGD